MSEREPRSTAGEALCYAALLLVFGAPVAAAQQRPPDPQRHRAVLEQSVGDIDGPLALTRVNHIVVHGDRVFVAQPAENLIRVLSADSGEILDEWGGPGDGPGEFRDLYWMGLFGDSLVTVDPWLRRTTVFGTDGTIIDARRFELPPPSPPFRFGGWIMGAPGGQLIVFGDTYGATADASSPDTNPWLLTSVGGRILDRLPHFRPRDRRIMIRGSGRFTNFTRPIHRSDRFALAPDGSRFAQAGEAESGGLLLTVYHTMERRTETFHLEIPAIAVPAAVADSVRRRLHETLEGRGVVERADRRELERALVLPERVPAVDEMFVTNEGEVWLREPSFSGSDDLWRVVNPEGNVEAVVDVPPRVVLRARQGDRLWGFRVEPRYGVVSIVRLRLEPVRAGEN